MLTSRSLVTAVLVALCVLGQGVGAVTGERPTERASPAPEANPNAVVWRTLQPPANAQPGDVWVDPKSGMEMVYVPSGEFTLGVTDAEVARGLKEQPTWALPRFNAEQPRCRVKLPGYWIGRTEVTNAQYLRFVRATGRSSPLHWGGDSVPAGLESFPVVNVSWNDARAYCEWAGHRLPTELEWEKAARGCDGRLFPWGNEWDVKRCRNFELVIGGRYYDTSRGAAWEFFGRTQARKQWFESHDSVREGPAPVGTYPAGASPYGCFDMAGNVSEWCSDWYDEKTYNRYARGDLTPPASGQYRVLRGASWRWQLPADFLCSRRDSFSPDFPYDNSIGFRCARRPGENRHSHLGGK
jgi:formylglycine-generating enzyme required for sulfatase activity